MNKNIIIIIGSFVVISFFVFLVSKNNSDVNTEVEQQVVESSETKERFDATQLANGEYMIDADISRIEWIGRAAGKRHDGQVGIKSAKINYVDGTPESGVIVLDMTSISNDDLSGKMQEQLVAHLKSNDFFAVADHPEAQLEIKSTQNIDENIYRIMADLTVKGETREVVFDARSEEKNGTVMLTMSFDIDRTKWGVTFGSETIVDRLSDQIIDDMISFDIVLIGMKDGDVL